MPSVTRRFATLLLLTAGFLTIFFIASLRHPSNDGTSLHSLHGVRPQQAAAEGPKAPVAPVGVVKGEAQKDEQKGGEHGSGVEHGVVPEELLHGHVIAPKLGNETAKALLGRASWHHLHTLLSRFPANPTPSESSALRAYLHLFQRLYPCGECAAHFGKIMEKFPPQVGSRNAAVGWGCVVHNEVNRSLGKSIYDCAHVDEDYDCGCADGEADGKSKEPDTHGASEPVHAPAGLGHSEEARHAAETPDFEHSPGSVTPSSPSPSPERHETNKA
ncbi:hypothetical protein H2201_005168 [Coniosporium apollinis]|uniref:Sulfhydryl oxidase n=1 Tax=Coniosporium apollinis TaxID=61459 RepID=A0ABQ9NT07_9PEZI|nr:hypothetical protein H2201_005168 [Coniosporium apollinis]